MKKTTLSTLLAAFFIVQANAANPEHQPTKGGKADAMPNTFEVISVTETKPTDTWNFGFYGAYTYWNGAIEGLQLATLSNAATQQAILFPDVPTRSGFLAGLDFMCPETGVGANVQYTWFYNKQNKGIYTQKVLTGSNSFVGDSVTWWSAGGTERTTFNRIDFNFTKEIHFGKYFSFAPVGGVVGNWSEGWLDCTFASATDSTTGTSVVANNQKNWGAGPYFAGQSQFILPINWLENDWSEFCLLVKGGLGFSWMENKTSYQKTDTNDSTNNLNVRNAFNTISTLLDGRMGLVWRMIGDDYDFCKFSVAVLWDIQNWNNYFMLQDQVSANDYRLQGLTAGIGLEF